MSFSVPALSGFLLLLQGAAAPAPVAVPLDASTRSQADSLSRKLQQIQQRTKAPARRPASGSVLVTEDELNAWLRADATNRPKGVSEMTVRFEPQRLVARGLVDLSLLKPKTALSPWHPLAWLSGVVPVDMAGRVESANGRATVTWDDIRISAIPVSPGMLRELVLTSTRGSRHYPDGFDILAPYPMPYDVQRVRIEPSRAILDF